MRAQLPRLRFITVAALLTILWGAGCADDEELGPVLPLIEVRVTGDESSNGSGRLTTAVPQIDCRVDTGFESGQCTQRTEDAGGGGVFEVVATPDAGSAVATLSGSCVSTNAGECSASCTPAAAGGVCNFSFTPSSGDVTFYITAGFELAGPDNVVLEDDFEDPDPCSEWSAIVTSSVGAVTVNDDCNASGGDLNSGYRWMAHTIDDPGSVVVFHRFEGATYTPSTDGAITRIEYSWRRAVITPAFVGGGVGEAVALEQGGQIFTHSLGAFTNTAWGTASGSLVASDFNGPAPGLDFSATGGPIHFGYMRSNTNNSTGFVQFSEHGMDNWRVVIVRE